MHPLGICVPFLSSIYVTAWYGCKLIHFCSRGSNVKGLDLFLVCFAFLFYVRCFPNLGIVSGILSTGISLCKFDLFVLTTRTLF